MARIALSLWEDIVGIGMTYQSVRGQHCLQWSEGDKLQVAKTNRVTEVRFSNSTAKTAVFFDCSRKTQLPFLPSFHLSKSFSLSLSLFFDIPNPHKGFASCDISAAHMYI